MEHSVDESSKTGRPTLTAVSIIPPRLPAYEHHAEAHQLIIDWPDLKQRITVRPTGVGEFVLEHGPITGQVSGCACISISNLITIKHGPDETLRVEITSVCEIKAAKLFSIVEGEEMVDGPIQIRNVAGVMTVRAGTIRMEITGDEATVLPKRVIEQVEEPTTRLIAAG